MTTPTRERAFLSAPTVSRFGITPTPFQFILSREDHLRCTAWNVVALQQVVISGRYLRPGESQVYAFRQLLQPSSDGFATTVAIPLGDCVLLNVVVRTPNVITLRGQCFVQVDIVRGDTALEPLGTLLAGYVAIGQSRAWPGSVLESPSEGAGWSESRSGLTPAAGSPATLDQPAESTWYVKALRVTLTTSAVAGNRNPRLELWNGNIVHMALSSLTQAAALPGVTHTWGVGNPHTPGLGLLFGQGGLPVDARMSRVGLQSPAVRVVVSGMDVGDQLSAILALVEEWRNPATQPS